MTAAASLPALGIDLGGTKIESVLLAADGSTLMRERRATPAGDYAATLDALADVVRAARSAAGGEVTIGMGTPGSAGPDKLMKNCNSTWLNGQPLQADMQARVGQAVVLANDANCLALSEATDGAGAGAPVVFAAILGTGVGAGIAVHGQVLHGANGLAGEWGHNPFPWADAAEDVAATALACYCGQRGCVETLLSGPALARDHGVPGLDARQIAQSAAAGDAASRDTLQRHARRLAQALASVINLLDPDVVVLGGGLSQMPHLYEEVPRLWGRWVFGAGVSGRVHTRLVPSLHGDASGVRGAAWVGRSAGLAP